MGMLCAVTFSPNGQLHYADPGDLRPQVGDMVMLPTEQGPVAARVVWAAEYSTEDYCHDSTCPDQGRWLLMRVDVYPPKIHRESEEDRPNNRNR